MPSHPHHATAAEPSEGAPPTHPSHTGFNEAALIPIVWVCGPLGIKLHTQEGRVWFMFVWWSGEARVHMVRNHVQHHTQQKHLRLLGILIPGSAVKTYLFLLKQELNLKMGLDKSSFSYCSLPRLRNFPKIRVPMLKKGHHEVTLWYTVETIQNKFIFFGNKTKKSHLAGRYFCLYWENMI